jgi:CRP-like cAMP-binding protein
MVGVPSTASLAGGEMAFRYSASLKKTAALAASKTLLMRRLSPLKELSGDEIRLLEAIVARRKKSALGEVLLGEGSPSHRPRFLLEGWACRQLILSDGRRQILGFLLPGDVLVPDFEGLLFGNVIALTPVFTGDFPQRDGPNAFYTEGALLPAALGSSKLEWERLLNQQVLRLGRMSGRERTAHLLLELHERLTNAGLCQGPRMPFPLTQEALGDALGMSTVHVNRTMQQLKREAAIVYASRNVLLVDVEKLLDVVHPTSHRSRDVRISGNASNIL